MPGGGLALVAEGSDMQLSHLRFGHRGRRAGQQALRRGGFRERDHVTDRFFPGHQRGDAVQPERDAAMRRAAVAQGFEQEPEFLARLLFADTQQAEDGWSRRRFPRR